MSIPRPIRLLAVVLACLGLVAPISTASASASELTDEDLTVLVEEVERDPSLYSRLKEVERVDQQVVDFDVPFDIDDAEHRSARLAELKRAETTPLYDAEVVRSAAQEILDNEPFANPDPNLIQRMLRSIDNGYQSILGGIWGLIGRVFDLFRDAIAGLGAPRPGTKFAWAFVAFVLTVSLFSAFRLLRNRQRGERALADEILLGGGSLLPDANADPDEYERRAEAAERAGDLAEALRLRFAVGVLRLHRAKRIRYRSTTTMADLRRQVDDPVFDRMASVFEWSVYGGYTPAPSDLARFRDDWTLLLEPARSAS